jgi:hypothetical protein
MEINMKEITNYKLTEDITVGELQVWINLKDDQSKERIIKLIHHRIYNRYIQYINEKQNGFLKMAVSCLIIETLESFKNGIPNTSGKSKNMFKSFFETEEEFFPEFKDLYKDFYYNIRCGILHQAETTNAWRILRKGNLLNRSEKEINAYEFVKSLNRSLDSYLQRLKDETFDSPLWTNAIVKLEDICENCKVKA